MREESTSD